MLEGEDRLKFLRSIVREWWKELVAVDDLLIKSYLGTHGSGRI